MENDNKTIELANSFQIKERPVFEANCNGYATNLNDSQNISNLRRALPQFLAVSVKNILLFVYGTTLGFPTIVIPAVQGGEGRDVSDIVLNNDEISWFSSINLICVPLGCLFSGILSQPIGKRRAMQLVNIPLLASWLLFHFATKSEHLYIALCLSGLGGGLMEAPVLTYVAEITEPKYRGILSALGSTCVITGVFVQFIMGSLMDWRTVAAVSSAFPIICIVALFFIPESPTWLMRKQCFGESLKALQWLRGWVPKQCVENEFNRLYNQLITQPALDEAIESTAEKNKSPFIRSLRMFKKRSFLVPFALVAYTFFTGHFSGKTSLQTYAVQIFHTLKAPINKYYATILLGVVEMIATVLCVFLIHFTGKRPLVLISALGVGLCWFGTATYAHYLKVVPGFAVSNVVINASSGIPKENIIIQNNISQIFVPTTNAPVFDGTNFTTLPQRLISDVNAKDFHSNRTTDTNFGSVDDKKSSLEVKNHTDGSKSLIQDIMVPVPEQEQNNFVWLPLVLLLGAAFFAHLGIRMIPWILIGEVFPAPVRSTASGLVSGLGYIFGFLANKLFLQMLAALTLPGTFWFYSIVAIAGTVILYFTLPETEGRTLGEIEAHFSKKSSTNLLCKKQQNLAKLQQYQPQPTKSIPVQGDNFININNNLITEQLQQHNGMPHNNVAKADEVEGVINAAYEDNYTTHL